MIAIYLSPSDESSFACELCRTEYMDLAKMFMLSHIHLQTKGIVPVTEEVVGRIFDDKKGYCRYDVDIRYDGSFVYLTQRGLDSPVVYSIVEYPKEGSEDVSEA